MNQVEVERCPSGINGFDRISQGGFVRNSANVILGGPGSGKTTFLLQFLYNGITKYDENGLYCSFEPDIVETINDAYSYGWDLYKLSESGRLKFAKFSPETTIDELKMELTKIVSQNNIRRICIDPISVLAISINEQGKIREKIFELVSLMKRLKVTTVLADESIDPELNGVYRGEEWTKTDIVKFLADSVTLFYSSGLAGTADRAIRIEKMRRTHHLRRVVGMEVTEKGIQVISD
jgi:circadian clock protein KaiC